MDSWGDRMPLPDAIKRSPRVYTNLQNIDLDTVTFANVQATGNPIAVEEMNEDEMRRLVLVNLARLVCAGEWNGLLTTASSASFTPLKIAGQGTSFPLMPSIAGSETATKGSFPGAYYASPFVCPEGGLTLSTDTTNGCQIYVSTPKSGSTLLVGIYSNDSDNNPETLLSEAEFDTTSSGLKTVGWDTAVTLDAGTIYWCAHLQPEGQTETTLGAIEEAACSILLFDDNDMVAKNAVGANPSTTTLPATFAGTLEFYSRDMLRIGLLVP